MERHEDVLTQTLSSYWINFYPSIFLSSLLSHVLVTVELVRARF